jgi:hypothetical protein
VSEPLTARTAAKDVIGEKGAARLAYLAARFAQGGGGRAAGGEDRSSAEIKRDGASEFACDGAFLDPV